MNSQPVLYLEDIVKVFPGVKALDHVHLKIFAGEVHALCGENGAGKSTLMKIIAGAQTYTSGKMYVEGREVCLASTKEAERLGISMIYQEFNLIPHLSVAENMYLGHFPKTSTGLIDWKKLYQDAQKILERLKMTFSSKTKVKDLSVAECSMTEIAKCLTIGAKVIIMDEPTAALSDEEIEILFQIIDDLKKSGIAIIYISHRMDEIFRIADCLTIFRDGKHIATKEIKATNYDEVVSMMVGRQVKNLYPLRNYHEEKIVFEVKNISGQHVKGISFQLHKGEILGITGLLGSGSIELAKLIYGALPKTSGEIYLNGKKIDCKSPRKALKNGIGFVSDDRKQEGLVLVRSIHENIMLSSSERVSKFLCLNKKEENTLVLDQIKNLNIKANNKEQLVESLSGGNQQKVVFAKVLESNPELMILNEPTRGVDVGAKSEIYTIIDELTKKGKSVLLISTDLPEMIGMSDRILVMREGKLVYEMSKEEMSQEKILAYASGGVESNE